MHENTEPLVIILVITMAALLGAVIALIISLTILKRQLAYARALAGGEAKPARFNWIIFWFFMLVTAACIAAIWLLIPTRYRAHTVLMVESPYPKIPMQLIENPVPLDVMERFIADQAILLKDDLICREALSSADVQATDWYMNQPDKNALLDELQKGLSIKPIPRTKFLEVSFLTASKKDAPVIVNTVIEKYLDQVKQMSEIRLSSEMAEYRKQETDLNESLKKILSEKQEFITEKLNAPDATSGLNVNGDTLRALAAEVTRLESEKLTAKATYDNLAGIDPSQIAVSPQMKLVMQKDPQVTRLQDKKLSLRLELRAAQTQPSADGVEAKSIQAQVEIVENELGQLIAVKEREMREYQINSAHTAYLNLMQAEMALRERMLEVEAGQRDLDQGLARFRTLEDQQKLITDQLNQVRAYTHQLKMIIDDRGKVRIRRIGPALEPTAPNHDLQAGLTAFALLLPVLGLVLGYLRTR